MRSFLFILISTSFVIAQPEFIYKEIVKIEQIQLFNNIEIFAQKDFESYRVRVLGLDNSDGSTRKSNCEGLTSIYIAISEYNGYPKQRLFKIDSLCSPSILRIFEEDSQPIIYLSFFSDSVLKCLRIKTSLNGLHFSLLDKEEFLLVSKPSAIFFYPNDEEIEQFNLIQSNEISEVISDLAYYYEKIKPYLIKQRINPVITSAGIIILSNSSQQPNVLFRKDFNYSVGLILTSFDKEPYIVEGVLSDVAIKEKINNYFKVRN